MQRVFYILLNFHGRIKRRTWFVFFLAIVAAEYCCERIFRDLLDISGPVGTGQGLFTADIVGDKASLLASLIFLWPSLALDVKRWHDIGKSAYYTLIIYGPFIAICAAALTGTVDIRDPQALRLMSLLALIALVYFIMLAARRGTSGANPYGPAAPMPFQLY
jgi:uncharacterized membrane protein YhaH (DUF805 family)